MKRFARLSLRQSLTVPYVVLVIGVASLIGALSYRAGSQAVDTVADHLLRETVGRIAQAVDRHIVGSGAVLEAAFPEGMPAPTDIEGQFAALRTRFWIATSLHLDPNNYVYYGTRQGQFFGLWRYSQQDGELRIKLDAAAPRSLYRFSGINGVLSEPELETKIYDPRVRPWYQAGETSLSLTWTSVYIDFRTTELVATRARRVLDAKGGLEGVVATDVSLRQLNDFVHRLKISEHALAFIIEPDGNLIASSRSPNTRTLADGSNTRINAIDSGNALQVATFDQVRQVLMSVPSAATPPRTMRFTGPNGESIQLAYERLMDMAGLDWIIVVAVPRSDFMQGVTENVIRTAAIGGVAALLTVLIGLAILFWVSRDLRRLAEAARQVGKGRLDAPLEINRGDEIGDLATSFRQMQQKLRIDTLTELLNRDMILRRITERIHQHRRVTDSEPFAVFFVDLNNFKLVNDRLGHDAGDRVLVEIGQRLRVSTRTKDLVARYAGDEFVLLIDEIRDVDAAEQIRGHIERILHKPLTSIDTEFLAGQTLGGAVGLARYPADADTANGLIVHADADMYARKRASKPTL
ncbi:MAG: diguanylate cyclase [Candidatus Competibacteraceae bacterium]|nr:MAG: diguanylate cyclase [Candidatus Competibacteraceae bacterium]